MITVKDIVLDLKRADKVETRDVKLIDGIALHHAGGPGDPYSWAPYHIDKWGSGVIGYHSVIMRNGVWYKTAFDSDRTPGVANHNRHLLHICFQGDLSKEGLTVEQVLSGLWAIKQYQISYAIKLERIKGHGDWADADWATACPGQNLGHLFRTLLKGA